MNEMNIRGIKFNALNFVCAKCTARGGVEILIRFDQLSQLSLPLPYTHTHCHSWVSHGSTHILWCLLGLTSKLWMLISPFLCHTGNTLELHCNGPFSLSLSLQAKVAETSFLPGAPSNQCGRYRFGVSSPCSIYLYILVLMVVVNIKTITVNGGGPQAEYC